MTETTISNGCGGGDNKAMSTSNYNFEEGKLRASIKWLITRIYSDQSQLPDTLDDPFLTNNEGKGELSQPVIACLTNGSFYCQAAAKIFHDSSFLNAGIDRVFLAFSQSGIDFRDTEGQCISAELLASQSPFNTNAHLHFIDSFMVAHLRSIVSIDRVVQAISTYAMIEKREEPLDCVDALLFWINKICLIVRDDIERNGVPSANDTNCIGSGEISKADIIIPEMEDLYEDLCDGTCICTLVSFYRPDELPLREICFKDPMSVNDCKFNLKLLRSFCESYLPWNPFHFRIDDILFLHESLQPNVNAFLADLFMFFEGHELLDRHQPAALPSFISTPGEQFGSAAQNQENSLLGSFRSKMECWRNQLAAMKTSHPEYGSPLQHSGDDSDQHASHLHNISTPQQNTTAQKSYNSLHQEFSPIGPPQNSLLDSNDYSFKTRQQIPVEIMQMQQKQQHFQGQEMPPFGSPHTLPRLQGTSKSQSYAAQQVPYLTPMYARNHVLPCGGGDDYLTSQPQPYFSSIYTTPVQNFDSAAYQGGGGHPLPQQQSSIYYTPTSFCATSNYPSNSHLQNIAVGATGYGGGGVKGGGGAIGGGNTMQQSISQPSHLNLLQQRSQFQQQPEQHNQFIQQQQCQVSPFPYQQMAMGATQQPQQHFFTGNNAIVNNPSSVEHSYNSYVNQLQSNNQPIGLPHQQHQQQYPIPQLAFNHPPPSSAASSTVFPCSTNDPYTLTNLHNYSVQMHQQQQQQPLEKQRPQRFGPSIPFRMQQANIQSMNGGEADDPQEDLRKELANWGMTYRVSEKPQRKTWAFKKAEMQQRIIASNPLLAMNATSVASRRGSGSTPAAAPNENISTHRTPKSSDIENSILSAGERLLNNSAGVALDVSDSDSTEMTPEMQAKRRALLASQIKRKERILAKSEEKEMETIEKRQIEMQKLEEAEQRRIERVQRRQKCLEDYKRRKQEQELGEQPGISGRMCSSSTMSLNNRGQSQPPFRRPKSQTNLNSLQSRTLQRPFRAQSSVNNSNDDENEGITSSRSNVPASVLGEPSLKLFARQAPKSNRTLILNALQYSIFPGHVSNENRLKVQAAIASSDSKHFLVLFRDHRLQYRALYTWDQFSDTVHKIEGTGPKVCREPMMTIMFKYDSGAKAFGTIPTKHISATIDGFVIADQYWQRPKIPYSGR